MITRPQLSKLARSYLRDAEVLFKGKRYDGAVYLCGYSIELALKARICFALKWADFPFTKGEFDKGLQSFKTHKLELLLKLSGRGEKIRTNPAHSADWSNVVDWDPESRYDPARATTQTVARDMIESARNLLRVI